MNWWDRKAQKNQAGTAAAAAAVDTDHDEVTLPPGTEQETTAAAVVPAVVAATTPVTQEHPVLAAALAAGVNTVADFQALQARADYGDQHAKQIGDQLTAQGIRLFGPEKGTKHATAMAHLPLEEQAATAQSWQEQADEKFGIGKNGEPAERTSAAPVLPQAVPAESTGGANNGSKWSKLTAEEQQFAKTMGHDKTEEAREAYAENVLKTKGES